MKKTLILLTAAALLLSLFGCGRQTEPTATTEPATIPTTEPPPTIPADGNPNDVTCKGSYTGTPDPKVNIAKVGNERLSAGMLQAYYWAEVAAYQASGQTPAPDFSKPLDSQVCEADTSVYSWQQFFLRRALNSWHTVQALQHQSEIDGLPTEEAFQPDMEKYAEHMQEIPATAYLYRYYSYFLPNSMHQAWLDAIPEYLENLAKEKGYGDAAALAQEALGTDLKNAEAFVCAYNFAYMYYTNLSYFIEPTEEELEAHFQQWSQENPEAAADDSALVTFRHILLLPEGGLNAGEEAWEACMKEAESLLTKWKNKNPRSEGSFSDRAYHTSADAATAPDGGAYRGIARGQLIPEIEDWCFAEDRKAGETTILRTDKGVHILYFSGAESAARTQAREELTAQLQSDLATIARKQYPISIEYEDIVLAEAVPGISYQDILYPDVAHERFPEIPLYLQQDYPNTKYGAYPIRTHGCGITTMAMLASYMTDDELTPPEMCARYGRYCGKNGTDGMMYIHEPPVMGFYLKSRTFNADEVHQALEEGYITVSVQTAGYWTRGGHYIALEKMNEDGTIQVRDSNVFNYSRLETHKQDRHAWRDITRNCVGYWIFEKKLTSIPFCTRCGDGTTATLLTADYTCHKCQPAILRRSTYLALHEQ